MPSVCNESCGQSGIYARNETGRLALKNQEEGALLGYILMAVGSLAATTPATADDTDALRTLEAFYGTCLANGPSFDRTKAAATLFKWKPLPPEALTMFAPQQAPDRFEGWLVTTDGYPKNAIGETLR
jgi:hypothetical protein